MGRVAVVGCTHLALVQHTACPAQKDLHGAVASEAQLGLVVRVAPVAGQAQSAAVAAHLAG